jgi:hypothetical protein
MAELCENLPDIYIPKFLQLVAVRKSEIDDDINTVGIEKKKDDNNKEKMGRKPSFVREEEISMEIKKEEELPPDLRLCFLEILIKTVLKKGDALPQYLPLFFSPLFILAAGEKEKEEKNERERMTEEQKEEIKILESLSKINNALMDEVGVC